MSRLGSSEHCPRTKLKKNFHATERKTQDIGGPHAGDADDEGYVLDLDDFDDLDETFAGELVSLISIDCANDVEITGVVAASAGTPTSVTCDGEECFSDGETNVSFK